MRFVGILAIEREAESAENAYFRGFLQSPATAGPVLRAKFRNAARLYRENCHVGAAARERPRPLGRQKKSCGWAIGCRRRGTHASLRAAARARTLTDRNRRAGAAARIARSASPFPVAARSTCADAMRADGGAGNAQCGRRNVIFSQRFSVKCARPCVSLTLLRCTA